MPQSFSKVATLVAAAVCAPAVASTQDVRDSTSRPAIDASVHGVVVMNGFYTSSRVNNSDVPQFVLPPSDPAAPPDRALGATVRQSRVTGAAFVPELLGGQLSAELDVDFYGGQQPSTGGRTFPLLRIRRAVAIFARRSLEVLVGQEAPPIALPNPSSIASIGFPDFAGSGNLWLWIPQIRVGIDVAEIGGARIGIEGAVLAPTSGQAQTTFNTEPDLAERSGRPYLQGRVRARWGAGDHAGELSIGGHLGWLAFRRNENIESSAVAVSIWTPLGSSLELRAEGFAGQALAGLGGGGIGQSFGQDSIAVDARGGWVQLNARPAADWEVGAGIGVDDPADEDLVPAQQRLRNLAYEAHAIWRRSPALIGAEVRRLETRYAPPTGTRAGTHVNLGVGFEF